MKLLPWDPDLATLLQRIKSGYLNLQPDFQRGEVWGIPKKRRLIDTILRQWHVPPVHVVVDPSTECQEVLDGQQRLAAIRDFANGKLTVDGKCQPPDKDIAELDGKTYEELPEKFRRRFDTYPLRVIKITDFRPEEPGELFFRLNQPANLTAAEQRNAFYGQARGQVKKLVSKFGAFGISPEVLGFENSRMAYDDVIAKVCYAYHVGDLRKKVTSGVVTTLYRSDDSFNPDAIERVRESLETFGLVIRSQSGLKFNKATFFSWLVFLGTAKFPRSKTEEIALFMHNFEDCRQHLRDQKLLHNGVISDAFPRLEGWIQRRLIEMFNDRAASRVADVSSVLIRHLILWVFHVEYTSDPAVALRVLPLDASRALTSAIAALKQSSKIIVDQVVDQAIDNTGWGILL